MRRRDELGIPVSKIWKQRSNQPSPGQQEVRVRVRVRARKARAARGSIKHARVTHSLKAAHHRNSLHACVRDGERGVGAFHGLPY